MTKILLTSFATWMSYQTSNSSDDLLEKISAFTNINAELIYLRKLPVNTQIASETVIEKINQFHPDFVICCGMAESRNILTLEHQAREKDDLLITKMNLKKIIDNLSFTKISYEAGQFVCEGLYYHVLKHIQTQKLNIDCVFLHVPVITPDNLDLILTDVRLFLNQL